MRRSRVQFRVVLLAGSALFAGAAVADSKNFTVHGTTPDGAAYDGTVVLESIPDTGSAGEVGKITWTIGGSQVSGLGMASKASPNALTVAFPGAAGTAGVMIITRQPDGSAKGEWLASDAKKIGTEIWTPASAAATPPVAATTGGAGAITYERAIECAAATSYVTGMLRATPGADPAKITVYDNANSAWTIKLSDYDAQADLNKRIADIQAKQQVWADDSDGMSKAQPIADDCVAHPPPDSN